MIYIMPNLRVFVSSSGLVLCLMALVWLLATLAFSVASAYGMPRFVIVFEMVSARRWIYVALWAIVPVLLLVRSIKSVFLEHRAAGLWWVTIPALGLLIVWPNALIGEKLRFYATKGAYDHVVSDAEAGRCSNRDGGKWPIQVEFLDCRQPVLITFDWGGLGSGWFGIVYDAADEIVKPTSERSDSWKHRDVGQMLSCSDVAARLGGHYYLTSGSLGDNCG